MNTVWKMRHAGSPQSKDGLSDVEILEGLTEGDWALEDEVQGPGETGWQPLESHPHFAPALEDYEPPIKPEEPDESRLDFNPLIDVALVLLIFFMLTTAYSMFAKVLDLPQVPPDQKQKPLSGPEVKSKLIVVKARKDGGKVTLSVDDTSADLDKLTDSLKEARKKTGKTQVLLDGSDDLEWETVTKIMDACTGAGAERMLFATKAPTAAPKPEE